MSFAMLPGTPLKANEPKRVELYKAVAAVVRCFATSRQPDPEIDGVYAADVYTGAKVAASLSDSRGLYVSISIMTDVQEAVEIMPRDLRHHMEWADEP